MLRKMIFYTDVLPYIINPLPIIDLSSWFDWLSSEEIIELGPSHSQIFDELYRVTSLLISVAPEQLGDIW